jgi:hypothetical protein
MVPTFSLSKSYLACFERFQGEEGRGKEPPVLKSEIPKQKRAPLFQKNPNQSFRQL